MNVNDIEFQKNDLKVYGSVENLFQFFLYNLAFKLEPLNRIFSETNNKKRYFSSLKMEDNVIDIELNKKISELKKRFKKEEFINFFFWIKFL